jgi:signal transduction histidine kinase
MTFRNKILFSIWGVVLSLLIITFFLLNYWIRSRIEETFVQELGTGFSTVRVHEKLQSAQLIRASAVIAESPRLRAVAELGDARTAHQLLGELSQSALGQLLVLTDRYGRTMVQLLNGREESWDISNSPSIRGALSSGSGVDVWTLHGKVYRVVTVPMTVENEIVGTITLGFEITKSDIATLKRATNSELLLVSEGKTVLSTLDSSEAQALRPSLSQFTTHLATAGEDSIGIAHPLSTADQTYLGTAFRLTPTGTANAGAAFFLIVKPLSREVRQAMASMFATFGLVSLVFLALTTAIGLVISRGMTRPIAALVQGTTEISRGNYDYTIRIGGEDELGILAQRFMEMSSSLKETITQLGKANRDLLERNTDLDDTLRQLRSAQEEIVRNERLAATGKMSAQLAHEINNPIHNIQSCLKTALTRLPDEVRGKDLIQVSYDEVNRLSRLTGQMLNFYRTSLLDEEMQPTDLAAMLGEVVTISQAELHTRKIDVHTAIAPDLPHVRGSRDKLKQVFLNLIANASDAMPSGGRLDIEASTQNGTVRISVKDTGVGIAREYLNRIFDAFFTTKGKVSGVGLGLSVSYGIISQHRGSIEVESTPGKGSAFTVIIPYSD